MSMAKIDSGAEIINQLLEGGYETDSITTVYGPAGSGKTNICMLCAISTVKNGRNVIYIDTDGSFSVSRLKQLSDDYEKIMEKIIFFKPTSFEEQKRAFEEMRKLESEHIGLVVVDSIAMLYRLELGKSDDVYETNRELGLQISYLLEIARKKNIPILVTNQVYADFENKNNIKMVGGDILKYGSKCLIELQKLHKNKRRAILKKHRSIAEEKEVLFEIVTTGIQFLERE